MAVCPPKTGTIDHAECMKVLTTMTNDQFARPVFGTNFTDADLLKSIDRYCESNSKLTVNFEVNIPLDSQRKKDIKFQNNRCDPPIDPNNKRKKPITFEHKTYCFDVNIPLRSNLEPGESRGGNNFPYESNYPLDEEDEEYDAEQETACSGGCGGDDTANTNLHPATPRQQRGGWAAPPDKTQPRQNLIYRQVCVTITALDYINPEAAGAGLVVKKTAYINLGSPCGGDGGVPGNPNHVYEPPAKGAARKNEADIRRDKQKYEDLMQKWRNWLRDNQSPDINRSAAGCICNFVACYSNSSLTRVGTYNKEKSTNPNDREDEKIDDLGTDKYSISMGRGQDQNTYLNISFTADPLDDDDYPKDEDDVTKISGTETWVTHTYPDSGNSSDAAIAPKCSCSTKTGSSFPPGSDQRAASDASFAAAGYSLICTGCTRGTGSSYSPETEFVMDGLNRACEDKAESPRTFIFCDQNRLGNLATVKGTYSDIFHHWQGSEVPFYLKPDTNSKYFDGEFFEIRTVDGKQRIVNKSTGAVQGDGIGNLNFCGGNTPNPPNNPEPTGDEVVVPNPPNNDADPDKTQPTNDVTEF